MTTTTRAMPLAALTLMTVVLASCAAEPDPIEAQPTPESTETVEVVDEGCTFATDDEEGVESVEDGDDEDDTEGDDEEEDADAEGGLTDRIDGAVDGAVEDATDRVVEDASNSVTGRTAGSAAFEFDDCVASDVGVRVTIPDDLRAMLGGADIPLTAYNITPHELESTAMCAAHVDFEFSSTAPLNQGFTVEHQLPPMTEEEIWDELLAEYRSDPEATAAKVTDKTGRSFLQEHRNVVRTNPAAVLSDFEEWAKVTTNYVADQVVWRNGAVQEVVYDRTTTLRIATTGAEYLDGDGAPILAADGETPAVADIELTTEVLNESSPSPGVYISPRLGHMVVVTDCADDVDDEAARHTVLLPIMDDTTEPAPFRTLAEVEIGITPEGEIAVDGSVDGYERDEDGAWAATS